MYQAVFFDLDGTLADSAPGIFGSMRYALAQFGITPSDEELHPFLGPPLQQMFAHFLPVVGDGQQATVAQTRYRGRGIAVDQLDGFWRRPSLACVETFLFVDVLPATVAQERNQPMRANLHHRGL